MTVPKLCLNKETERNCDLHLDARGELCGWLRSPVYIISSLREVHMRLIMIDCPKSGENFACGKFLEFKIDTKLDVLVEVVHVITYME